MRRREPAQPMLIGDLMSSAIEGRTPEEEAHGDSFITSSGGNPYRVIISGVMMEKEDIGTDAGPIWRVRIADPTGGMTFTVGRFAPYLANKLKDVPVPSFVTVIGKLQSFISRKGNRIMTLNAERMVRCTKEERDLWNLAAVRDAMARTWALAGKGQLPGAGYEVEQPVVPRGGEETQDTVRELIQSTLLSIDRGRFLKPLDDARSGTLPSRTVKEENGLEDWEGQVVQMINDVDRGDGARWDEIVDHIEKNRLSRDVIEEVISNLLDKGLVYEPVLGYLKAV